MKDVGRFLRLKSAIQAALDSIPVDQAAVAAVPMTDAYGRLRIEARSAIPEENVEEFDRLFPERVEIGPNRPGGRLSAEASKFNAARSLLGSLGGWLDGYVQEARMAIEAQEYAEARVKDERGVGFRGAKGLTST